MDYVDISIRISLEVEQRLKDLAAQKGYGIDYMPVAYQCMEVMHTIQTHWRARRYIYDERQQLPFPAPKDRYQVEMHELRLCLTPNQALHLQELCSRHRVDQQSVLMWAMDCLEIIEDKLMTGRLFSGLASPHPPLTFSWLHSTGKSS